MGEARWTLRLALSGVIRSTVSSPAQRSPLRIDTSEDRANEGLRGSAASDDRRRHTMRVRARFRVHPGSCRTLHLLRQNDRAPRHPDRISLILIRAVIAKLAGSGHHIGFLSCPVPESQFFPLR